MNSIYSSQQSVFSVDHNNVYENCAFEIGIHDLELDSELVEYFSKDRPDLQVHVNWTFLGLQQKTNTLPVAKAYFDLKVTYCGPPSVNVCNHLKQTTVVLELTLEDQKGNQQRFGEGVLELLPALQQPGRRFFRCIPVSVASGQALLYCSFKQHNDVCDAPVCPGGYNCLGCTHVDCPRRIVTEFIEVSIGRLKLEKMDFPTRTRAPHIYVEYSILGYCGSQLETESEPKSDMMEFKHKKRLRITEKNAVHLERMLKKHNPEPLTFIVNTEPCELSRDKNIEEIGSASLNLRQVMVEKDQDLVSAQLPVLDKNGELKGNLSVTILGIDTLRRHAE